MIPEKEPKPVSGSDSNTGIRLIKYESSGIKIVCGK